MKNVLKTAWNRIRNAAVTTFAYQYRFTVVTGLGTHPALSFEEALEWASCYRGEFGTVSVYHRGVLVAQRGA